MAENMNYLYTIGGYATLLGLGFVVYQLSTQKDRKRAAAAPTKASKLAVPESRKEDKKKKQRMASFSSEAQEASKKAAKAKAAEKAPEEKAWPTNAASGPDDNVDDREFARQLTRAKEGAKFATKSEGGKQREKSVKQSRANIEAAAAAKAKVSAPAPVVAEVVDADADADDDQSSESSSGPAVAGDVSDMLEPAPSAPKVLRLTGTESTQKPQQKPKAAQPVESKKQRQNRKKAEASKAAREESEKDRKVLEEKQRRAARIAEGRAAKDGSQFMAAAANNSSAWTKVESSSVKAATTEAPKTNGFHQPLDTFEQPAAQPSSTVKPAEGNWAASLPSEEEQLDRLKEDDEWSTVKTKASKKAAKNEASLDSGDEPAQARPVAQPQQAPVRTEAPKSTPSFGSFSALQSKDDPVDDEEEEEEEWDV